MTVLKHLDKRFVDLSFVVLGGVAVWFITQKLNNIAHEATKAPAELISDLTAYFNGWEAVELQPLLIRDVYLNHDYTLTPEASATLWSIEQYQPLLVEIFGTPSGTMKDKYKPLINQPIGK